MSPKVFWLQFLACVLFASNVLGAEIRVIQTGTAVELIHVSGELKTGDAKRFTVLVSKIDLGAVLLESPGGVLIEGLKIGQNIRSKGFTTGVAPNTACASACGLAWLAGAKRYMDPSSLVGFHAASVTIDGNTKESGWANALVGAYLSDLGFGLDAIFFATSAAPDQMNWLNAMQARESGIEVTLLTPDDIEVEVAPTQILKLPKGFRWIVLESNASPDGLAMSDIASAVVKTRNGYFASVLGPFSKAGAEDVFRLHPELPEDAYLSSGNGFLFLLK